MVPFYFFALMGGCRGDLRGVSAQGFGMAGAKSAESVSFARGVVQGVVRR
jgi:hypothetical protein